MTMTDETTTTDLVIFHPRAGQLAQALENVLPHCGSDSARPTLRAVLLEREAGEAFRVVGCDSYSLIVQEIPTEDGVQVPETYEPVLLDVPDVKAAVKLLKAAKNAAAELRILAGEVSVSAGGSTLTFKTVDLAYQYPKYRQLLEQDHGTGCDSTALAPWQLAKFAKVRPVENAGDRGDCKIPVRFSLPATALKPVGFKVGADIFGIIMPVQVEGV